MIFIDFRFRDYFRFKQMPETDQITDLSFAENKLYSYRNDIEEKRDIEARFQALSKQLDLDLDFYYGSCSNFFMIRRKMNLKR